MALWVGLSVTALTALSSAVAAMTSANWAYMRPVRPGRNAAGMNTDISTSVMPMIGANSSSMALDRRVVAAHALLDVVGGPLHHHDRVVHHDADRQHDGEQGRQIDGEAQRRHGREGADDGHRHGGGRHQGAAPVLQEDQDDGQHQDAGLDQRLVDLIDRGGDEFAWCRTGCRRACLAENRATAPPSWRAPRRHVRALAPGDWNTAIPAAGLPSR